MDVSVLLNWVKVCCLGLMLCLRDSLSMENMEYLRKYGYLAPSDGRSGNLISEEYLKQAVSQFQRIAGLPVTGIMNNETRKIMALPRCGVSDTVGTGNRARRKRYALHGSSWQKRDRIYYRISEYSRKISKDDVQRELQRAFDLWSEVIPLSFVRREYGRADIEIRFVTGNHGDNTPFDGSGQTLAHAYFPQYGGDAHFDEDEKWTVNIADGVNLYQVAAHEFGHSLGLAHSDVRSALMAPFYRGYDQDFKLDRDDILAVQELYGTKTKPDYTSRRYNYWTTHKPSTLKPHKPFVHIPSICRNATIDAITRTDNGITYMFQGEYYYRLDEQGIDTGYPRAIQWDWGSIEGPIDAALTWPNGWTFIFKGSHYWKFHNLQLIYGPKNISEGFDGIPGDIDTAFVWSGNGKTYFVKGNKYWRYHGNRIDYGYPRELKIWRGLPERINAAFQWKNGKTYFFSEDQYYRYNDLIFNIDTGGYPRDTAPWWLGCPDKSQIIALDRQNAMQDKYGVKYDTFSSDRHSRHNDEQWITVDEPSGFHVNNDNSVHSGAVIHSHVQTSLQALCISFFITNSMFLYYPVFTLH
ncbi:matrix metalloproteinase-24-like [Mercenaria mercenaria]|uniref:matrix metalloproteinase-24-like n=1 Tax=Mercenaria mercenaria TaxID=6596 RepID=UPI00234F1326|nr:matrix metalloproteinase-24-like [Mercenaria mercenaria]XP_053403530.1 matrix metalloproteinase-24-like [Mercenaria mercenaria]